MRVKFIKIITIFTVSILGIFLLLSIILPGHSYIIKNSVFAAPISAAKLIAASISGLTDKNGNSDDSPQNILILGIPGKPNNAPYLTDTIIVAQINRNTDNTSINTVSIPRDLLVENNGFWQRINALYVNGKSQSHNKGIENIKLKVEEITGIPITNCVMIDIMAVKELVNQVNGINISVPKDIHDPRFPGPGNSYETFEIKKGWRYLDGDTALRYARTRNDFEGDFGRIKRQLQIIRALKEKIFSLNPVFNIAKFFKILKTLNNHVETDLSYLKIAGLWNLSKNIDINNSHHVILDTGPEKSILRGTTMMMGEQEASVLIPVEGIGEYAGIQNYIKTLLNE